MVDSDYNKMWEDYAKEKSNRYKKDKFRPVNRIGLTNYMREKFILRFLPLNKSDLVIDVGCAAGNQVFKISPKVKFCHGVDISNYFIEFANKDAIERKIKNVKFETSVSENLPFKNETFDKVLCSEVLEHVNDLDASIKELYRITKFGGNILITVPNLNADGTIYGRLLRKLGLKKFTPLTEFNSKAVKNHNDSHVREFSHTGIAKILTQYGFRVKKLTTVSMLDFGWDLPWAVILRIKPLQKLTIWFETFLSKKKLKYGRHTILLCEK